MDKRTILTFAKLLFYSAHNLNCRECFAIFHSLRSLVPPPFNFGSVFFSVCVCVSVLLTFHIPCYTGGSGNTAIRTTYRHTHRGETKFSASMALWNYVTTQRLQQLRWYLHTHTHTLWNPYAIYCFDFDDLYFLLFSSIRLSSLLLASAPDI